MSNSESYVDELMSSTTVYNHSKWALYGPIEYFECYQGLIKHLYNAKDNDTVTIDINSTGGDVSVGMMIADAIMNSKAYVKMNVVYSCYSMGSFLALAGDYLTIQRNTFLMFHTYSGGHYGKSHEIVSGIDNDDKQLKAMINSLISPFLSKKELQQMHEGRDIYIPWNDETLSKRIDRHFRR